MSRDILREVAFRARQRLINKHNKVAQTHQKEITIKLIDENDEEFNMRAKTLLLSDDTINPFKILMDEKILRGLDEQGKERYLFETIDKFAKLKDKLERENEHEMLKRG